MSALKRLISPADDGSFSALQEQAVAELAAMQAVIEAARFISVNARNFEVHDPDGVKRRALYILAAALAKLDGLK